MIGNLRNMDFRRDTCNRNGGIVNKLDLFLPQGPILLVISGKIHFDRYQHTQYLFLIHFHSPPDCVAIGWRIFSRGGFI